MSRDTKEAAARVAEAAGQWTGGLDEAWAEVEAALPESGLVSLFKGRSGEPFEAHGYTLPTDGNGIDERAEGRTPAAALRALAQQLRGRP